MSTPTLTSQRIPISEHTVREARSTSVPRGAELVLRSQDGEEIPLPDAIQEMLVRALVAVADSGEVTIGSVPENLTSTVAADMLSISRPTLMKWARDGLIDSFKVGTHTRFKRDEVLRVRAERARTRRDAFDEMRRLDVDHSDLLDDGA